MSIPVTYCYGCGRSLWPTRAIVCNRCKNKITKATVRSR